MSRRRPNWASSRRILYGEVSELDRAALAMNHEEAHDLLRGMGAARQNSWILRRDGPLFLALASMSGAAPPDLTAAPHLYGFFADEIYRRIDRRVRRVLCELALYDTAGRHLALSQLRPDVVERVIATGVDNGFLTELDDKRLDMHPLLRAFLQRKLEAEGSVSASRGVARAVGVLIQHQLWDEAFELIRRFEQERVDPRPRRCINGRAPRVRSGRNLARMDCACSRRTRQSCDSRLRSSHFAKADTTSQKRLRSWRFGINGTSRSGSPGQRRGGACRSRSVTRREARAYFRNAQKIAQSPS